MLLLQESIFKTGSELKFYAYHLYHLKYELKLSTESLVKVLIFVQAAFTVCLGPFAYFDVQKTKYLQIATSLLRWFGRSSNFMYCNTTKTYLQCRKMDFPSG